jgi:hypothetical protein
VRQQEEELGFEQSAAKPVRQHRASFLLPRRFAAAPFCRCALLPLRRFAAAPFCRCAVLPLRRFASAPFAVAPF